jgi:hypothetical protein
VGTPDRILLDSGQLFDLRDDWKDPSDGFSMFKSYCLSLAFDLCQAGSPVMLLGATTPAVTERLPERKYFLSTSYLAVVCEDKELERRLRRRAWWREDLTPFEIEFNRWLGTANDSELPGVERVDTSALNPESVATRVRSWLYREESAV